MEERQTIETLQLIYDLADLSLQKRDHVYLCWLSHAAVRVGQWKWMDMPDRGGGLSLERPEILQQLKERFHIWEQAMAEADPRGTFRDF